MNVYYLCPPGTQPVRPLDHPRSHVVRPLGTSGQAWLNARQKALEHAAGAATDGIAAVIVGHCDVNCVQRRDWAKVGAPPIFEPIKPDARWDHSFITYVERLCTQYAAAVYVPPVGGARQVTFPWDMHSPTIPMVAVYRVEAALRVGANDASLGYKLASQGYRTLTLGDYCYTQAGPTVMDEYGSASKWRKAYAQSIEELLGVRSRHQRER